MLKQPMSFSKVFKTNNTGTTVHSEPKGVFIVMYFGLVPLGLGKGVEALAAEITNEGWQTLCCHICAAYNCCGICCGICCAQLLRLQEQKLFLSGEKNV